MSFEITFLGSSGGPVEGTTCSIMIKPRKVSYQDILTKKLYHQLITIDAGSGLAQLTETIYNEIHTQQPTSKHLLWYQDSLPVNEYIKSTNYHAVQRLRHSYKSIQTCSTDYLQDVFISHNTSSPRPHCIFGDKFCRFLAVESKEHLRLRMHYRCSREIYI